MNYRLLPNAWRAGCAAAVVAAACWTGSASARDLTFTSWGGAYQDAESKAYLQPFTAATGTKIAEDSYTGEIAKIRSQVESGAITWDVVDVAGDALAIGCQQGLFEKLDWSKIADKADFIPAAVQECAIGMSAGGVVLTYDQDKFPDGPKTWADMWDVKKWPGKRGLSFDPKLNLDMALLADGVSKNDLYKVLATPAGVDRAFAKLDQLKPNIHWYKTEAEAVQNLASGEFTMAMEYYGRVFALNKSEKRNFAKVDTAGYLLELTNYAVLKGSPNLDSAYKLLAFAAQPKIQAGWTNYYPYGPANTKAYDLIAPDLRAKLLSPTEAGGASVFVDEAFWAANLEDLQKRFSAWAAK
jgi:putative spermidine/putrescine transport system substrate-binding protein